MPGSHGGWGPLVRGLRRDTAGERRGESPIDDRDGLAKNIALAESLGATVVRVKADRPADGLIAFANREGITHVILDRPHDRAGRSCCTGRYSIAFLQEIKDASVQVVPLTETRA